MDEGGGKHTPSFRLDDFRRLLNSTEEGTAYEKGVIWENAAEYMLERITGLRIGGKRLSVARQEIDLCCMNISTDEKLWDLGALILVECKNLGKKADGCCCP